MGLQCVLLEQRSPKKIPSKECLQGAELTLYRAEFTRAGKEFSSKNACAWKTCLYQNKSFLEEGCIYATPIGRVSQVQDEFWFIKDGGG